MNDVGRLELLRERVERARAERDATALHQALAEAIKRLSEGRGFVMGSAFMDCFRTDDLLELLDRTSQSETPADELPSLHWRNWPPRSGTTV